MDTDIEKEKVFLKEKKKEKKEETKKIDVEIDLSSTIACFFSKTEEPPQPFVKGKKTYK